MMIVDTRLCYCQFLKDCLKFLSLIVFCTWYQPITRMNVEEGLVQVASIEFLKKCWWWLKFVISRLFGDKTKVARWNNENTWDDMQEILGPRKNVMLACMIAPSSLDCTCWSKCSCFYTYGCVVMY
jgi:hypothetical protein